jgi:hypothetical protein
VSVLDSGTDTASSFRLTDCYTDTFRASSTALCHGNSFRASMHKGKTHQHWSLESDFLAIISLGF